MCIIVAKNAGIKMPSTETLSNCFDNNPDGAGFMLAAKNMVYGFKGLMTFSEFKQELKKAEKRFGNLDKLPVVLHFRISTHGSSIGGNTHPFPLKGGYREMRKTEWQAEQGFAHNGIIAQTSRDPDIRKHNVSDTMVFAKKYINPIAQYATIASDRGIMDMLFELAGSKLCFLSKKGKISTRGQFVEKDGVLYSNTSYEERSYLAPYGNNHSFSRCYNYDYTSNYHKTSFRLDKWDAEAYMQELAEEYGYFPLPEGVVVEFCDEENDNQEIYCSDDYLFLSNDGCIYRFDEDYLEFILWACAGEYNDIIYPEGGDEI